MAAIRFPDANGTIDDGLVQGLSNCLDLLCDEHICSLQFLSVFGDKTICQLSVCNFFPGYGMMNEFYAEILTTAFS